MKKILIIAAHFDDVELAAGGSISRWVREGKEVYKIVLTDNITKFRKKNINVEYEKSKEESTKAAKILGIKEVLDFPVERCLNLQYNKKQMKIIESFILDNNIDTVLMHHMFDVQQDHVHAFTISNVAARYCNRLLTYQSNKYILPIDFYPRYFVDITKDINKKIEALNCYSSEHNRNNKLFDMTIQQNKVFGYQANLTTDDTYAEAFHIIKFLE